MRSHRDSNQDPSVEKYRLIKDGFSQQRRDEAVFTGDGQRTEIPPPISLDRMSLTGVRRLNEFRSTLGNKSSTSEAGKANTNTLSYYNQIWKYISPGIYYLSDFLLFLLPIVFFGNLPLLIQIV